MRSFLFIFKLLKRKTNNWRSILGGRKQYQNFSAPIKTSRRTCCCSIEPRKLIAPNRSPDFRFVTRDCSTAFQSSWDKKREREKETEEKKGPPKNKFINKFSTRVNMFRKPESRFSRWNGKKSSGYSSISISSWSSVDISAQQTWLINVLADVKFLHRDRSIVMKEKVSYTYPERQFDRRITSVVWNSSMKEMLGLFCQDRFQFLLVRGRQLKTENAVALKSFKQLNFRYLNWYIEGYNNAIISILNKSEKKIERKPTR